MESYVHDQLHANPGNFVALLQFKMQSGDKVVADHLASSGRSSLYTSKTAQNELVGICGSIIQFTIVSHIQVARIFL